MTIRIALIGGQGYPLTETRAGLPTLATRLRGKGYEVELFSHRDRQQIRDWVREGNKRALVGDSLGAGAAALYAGDLKGPVDFVGGFQPSAWDPVAQGPIFDRTIIVAHNVLVAHCIWDPRFIDTLGLGNARYFTSLDAQTILTTTEKHGFHPDDWGYSQDLMFNHMVQVLGASK